GRKFSLYGCVCHAVTFVYVLSVPGGNGIPRLRTIFRLADSQNEALDRPLWGTILRSAPWNHPVVTAQLRTPSDGLRCANSVTSPLQGGGWVGVPPLAGTQVDDQGD